MRGPVIDDYLPGSELDTDRMEIRCRPAITTTDQCGPPERTSLVTEHMIVLVIVLLAKSSMFSCVTS